MSRVLGSNPGWGRVIAESARLLPARRKRTGPITMPDMRNAEKAEDDKMMASMGIQKALHAPGDAGHPGIHLHPGNQATGIAGFTACKKNQRIGILEGRCCRQRNRASSIDPGPGLRCIRSARYSGSTSGPCKDAVSYKPVS